MERVPAYLSPKSEHSKDTSPPTNTTTALLSPGPAVIIGFEEVLWGRGRPAASGPPLLHPQRCPPEQVAPAWVSLPFFWGGDRQKKPPPPLLPPLAPSF